jgi:hypothetical protein
MTRAEAHERAIELLREYPDTAFNLIICLPNGDDVLIAGHVPPRGSYEETRSIRDPDFVRAVEAQNRRASFRAVDPA